MYQDDEGMSPGLNERSVPSHL